MSTPALAALQRQFLARLRGLPDDGFIAAVADDRMSCDTGLRIYVHAYAARLREALENDHPQLAVYLGDTLWERLCHDYIAAQPSRHRSLRDFGNGLPDHLAGAADFRAHPQVAELARFERQLLDSFDAADAGRATWSQLTALPDTQWPGLQPRFHPSVRLHGASHDSVEIWRALKAGQPPPPPSTSGKVNWVLWRDAERVGRFHSLDASEGHALQHCLHGHAFAEVCRLLTDTHASEDVPALALGYLRQWCEQGWIAAWS